MEISSAGTDAGCGTTGTMISSWSCVSDDRNVEAAVRGPQQRGQIRKGGATRRAIMCSVMWLLRLLTTCCLVYLSASDSHTGTNFSILSIFSFFFHPFFFLLRCCSPFDLLRQLIFVSYLLLLFTFATLPLLYFYL